MKWELGALKILARHETVPGVALRDAIGEIERLNGELEKEKNGRAENAHAYRVMAEFNDAHMAELAEAQAEVGKTRGERDAARKVNERLDVLEEALQKIVSWSEAYPLDVFPEPDMAFVAALLKEWGESLDCVSASNMRHVVEGVGKIARTALEGKEQGKEK